MISKEAGHYHIIYNADPKRGAVPVVWKRSDNRTSYQQIPVAELISEYAAVQKREVELRARLSEVEPEYRLGRLAIARLYDQNGDIEVIAISNTDDDTDRIRLFHPVEFDMFIRGAKIDEFDHLLLEDKTAVQLNSVHQSGCEHRISA